MNCPPPLSLFSSFRYRSLTALLGLALLFALPTGASAADPAISVNTNSGRTNKCSPDNTSGERTVTIKLTASKPHNGTIRLEAGARSTTSQKVDSQHQISLFGPDLIARGGEGAQFFTIRMNGTTTKTFNLTATNPVDRRKPPLGALTVTVLPPKGGSFWTTLGGQTSGNYNHGVGYTVGSKRFVTVRFWRNYC